MLSSNVAGCMTFREKLISICRLLIWPDSLKPITKTRLFKYIENFTPKSESFQIKKNSDIFHISAQNIDCGYWLELPQRGSSNEYPQSRFVSRNKKTNAYPCKPQFTT